MPISAESSDERWCADRVDRGAKRLAPHAADGFDGRARPTRALEDLRSCASMKSRAGASPSKPPSNEPGSTLNSTNSARAVGFLRPIPCPLSATHLPYGCLNGLAPRELTLLRHPLECLALALYAVEKLSALGRKKLNDLVLPARRWQSRSGWSKIHQLTRAHLCRYLAAISAPQRP